MCKNYNYLLFFKAFPITTVMPRTNWVNKRLKKKWYLGKFVRFNGTSDTKRTFDAELYILLMKKKKVKRDKMR